MNSVKSNNSNKMGATISWVPFNSNIWKLLHAPANGYYFYWNKYLVSEHTDSIFYAEYLPNVYPFKLIRYPFLFKVCQYSICRFSWEKFSQTMCRKCTFVRNFFEVDLKSVEVSTTLRKSLTIFWEGRRKQQVVLLAKLILYMINVND